MDAKHKAQVAYCTGETVVTKEILPEVLKELKAYNGTFYHDIEMNGLVLIQKA